MKKKHTSMISIIMSIMLLTTFSCNDKKWSESASEESSFSETSAYQESSAEEYSSVVDSSIEDGLVDEEPEQPVLPEYEPDPAPTSPIVASGVKIAMTESNAYVIDEDGLIWAWGSALKGLLGNGKTEDTTVDNNAHTPQRIMHDGTFITLSASATHAVAVDTEGRLWGWGAFDFGEEDIKTYEVFYPVQTLKDYRFKQVAVGYRYTLAIEEDGTLWSWGKNTYGTLGNGTKEEQNRALPITYTTKFSYATTDGLGAAYAIDIDGGLWTWGTRYIYGLGDGTTNASYFPKRILENEQIAQVTASATETFALTTDGRLYAWGNNKTYRLADGTNENRLTPTFVLQEKRFTYIETGSSLTYAIDTQGKTWVWGNGITGTGEECIFPTQLNMETGLSEIVCEGATLAKDNNGEFWCWGATDALTGDKRYQNILSPIPVLEEMCFSKVYVLSGATYAIDTEQRLWCWGAAGRSGENGSLKQVLPDKKIVELAIGDAHYLAIDDKGALWGWGANHYGQLGNGTQNNIEEIIQIMPDKKFIKVAAGYNMSYAIDKNGNLWAWGYNDYNFYLGTGKRDVYLLTPTQVLPGKKIVQVVTHGTTAFAIDVAGNLRGWGLGDFYMPYEIWLEYDHMPMQIFENARFTAVSTYVKDGGVFYGEGSFAVDTEGNLWLVRGYDGGGDKPLLCDNQRLSSVAQGAQHALALTQEGKLLAWGNNKHGQLGNGVTGGEYDVLSDTVVRVMHEKTFVYIAAGGYTSFAIDTEGKLYGWGENNFGKINGGSKRQLTPKQITVK